MGLASKLAAANSGLPPPGAPSASSAGVYGGPAPPAPPQQNSYPGQQQPPPQAYGAPPASLRPGQGIPYSGPPPPGQSGQQYGGGYGQPQSQYGQPGGYGQQGGYSGQHGGYGQQQGGYGQTPQGQYGQPPQPGAYGQSPQPGQHSGAGQYGVPPGVPPRPNAPGVYGAQPPPPAGARPPYQAAGAAGGNNADPRFIMGVLQQTVQDQNLQNFYPPGSLDNIAQRIAQSGALNRVAQEWRMPMEIASDLAKLALFDTILYVDDSGSMAFEQGGERIDDLKLILHRVSYAASLFDQDGIQVRFMNSDVNGDNITTQQQAEQLLQRVRFSGLTPLGTSMDRKILQPLVLGPARAGRLQKPILIITITDGAPAGEDKYAIAKVIANANRELARTRYGPDAVSFQFAQVGDDQKAQSFLSELDNHPEVGGLVDCTSNFEYEQAEMMRKSGQDLTPDLWIMKMIMGGIDSSYDEKDETR